MIYYWPLFDKNYKNTQKKKNKNNHGDCATKTGTCNKETKKSTADSKNTCDDETEKTMKETKLQKKKKKLELRLQEFFSLVEELMRTNNGSNEHDLEKEYEELDNVRNTAMVTLMEINSKLEFLNEQLEKEKKLCKEQL